ncbi:Glycogen phosphorylase [bioreactor metagenome]|uniref:glycogen phosphorylase n=1 Tax=bioreactor metagenome TaxID=1076179 RepID=A0A645C817_9ZZZZ
MIKDNPDIDIVPRTFIFGAKAAAGYKRAKDIIKLINSVADVVNNDSAVNGKIKVVFMANYCVSLAERLVPAADVSEQISTAGKEASGTGNMKFMLNGALTIGTLDGANVEIHEEVGDENIFIFGLSSDETESMAINHSYNPWDVYNSDQRIRRVVDSLVDGTFSGENHDIFRDIYNSLLANSRSDEYYVLKDFSSYVDTQEKIGESYKNKDLWAKMAVINTAKSGKFSSDRTIREYANDIWNLKPLHIEI